MVKVGCILDSEKAFDAYYDATGKVPPPMPDGANTQRIPFRLVDEGGVERAAMLVRQTGFPQTAEEIQRGQEADGLSMLVAIDAAAEEGERILADWSAKMLWPENKRGGSAP